MSSRIVLSGEGGSPPGTSTAASGDPPRNTCGRINYHPFDAPLCFGSQGGWTIVQCRPSLRDAWLGAAATVCAIARHVVTRPIAVDRPLPDVADHVEQAVAVRGEGADRGGALPSVQAAVLVGKASLPVVGHRPSLWHHDVAP